MIVNNISIIKEILDNGFQIDPEAFELIKNMENKQNLEIIIMKIIKKKESELIKNICKEDIINYLVPLEKSKNKKNNIEINSMLEIINNPGDNFIPSDGLNGFKELFESRYNKFIKLMSIRPDFHSIENIVSLNKSSNKKIRRTAGLVMDKKIQNDKVIITIDDDTGLIEVLALDKIIVNKVKNILLDSFVIIDLIFSKSGTAILKSINLPDIPDHKPILSKEQVYAIFTSDLHVGSKNFLNDEFVSFIEWLNDKKNENEIKSRIKYLVIAGDSVDGIGVYPGQENELTDCNVNNQYSKLAELLKLIPNSIEILIIPGNHDPVRQALPQPPIPRKYANELYSMSNVTMLGNPVYVRLHGVNLLIYHGRSLDDVISNIPGFSYNRSSLAMKLLLKSRHLSPIYGLRSSVLPSINDELIISDVPDIFHSGHVHMLDSESYRGTLILNSGSWQSQTSFQEKMGIMPDTGIMPIVNLSTLDVITKNFKIQKQDT